MTNPDQSDAPFDPAAEAVEGIGPYIDVGGNRWATWAAYEQLERAIHEYEAKSAEPTDREVKALGWLATELAARLFDKGDKPPLGFPPRAEDWLRLWRLALKETRDA